MPDTKVVGRHPLHPALVHFPIACWVLSHPADLAALLVIDVPLFDLDWWTVSILLIWTGVITALPAMCAGVYDFMQLPDDDRLLRAFYRHTCFVGAAWTVYLASGYLRLGYTVAPGLLPALVSGLGLVCLCIGGWYGGQLVYKYRLGSNGGG